MRIPTALALSMVVAMVGHAQQDQAATAFESLFGPKVRAVKKTATKQDDVELAVEMLAAARQSTEQKPLLVLFCDNAYDLGASSPNGYDHAVNAMKPYGLEK